MALAFVKDMQTRSRTQPDLWAEFVCSLREWANHRIQHIDLLKKLSTLFREDARRISDLNSFFPSNEIQLECPVKEGIAEFVMVITPTRTFIYPTLTPTLEPPEPHITDTDHLRTFINSHSDWSEIVEVEPGWAQCVSILLQAELDNKLTKPELRRRCLYCLLTLVGKMGKLPSQYLLRSNVDQLGTQVCAGGLSTIWKGNLKGKAVCFKVLSSSKLHAREQCTEALLWRQLQHLNILPLWGVSEKCFAPHLCLISPWMEHGNITDYLIANPDVERLPFLSQIAQGMKYLHESSPKIIHGDIKGPNILIDSHLCCRIADFGLSSVAETRNSTTSTSSGGTIRYMGPELLGPTEFPGPYAPIRLSSDVYAFGCTVYELYTGHCPWIYDQDEIVIEAVLKGQRPDRPMENARFPDGPWALFERCVAQDHAERPTAGELVDMLSIYDSKKRRTDELSIPRPPFSHGPGPIRNVRARERVGAFIFGNEPVSASSDEEKAPRLGLSSPEATQRVAEKPSQQRKIGGASRPRYRAPPPPSVAADSDSDSSDGADSDASTRAVMLYGSYWGNSHVSLAVKKPVLPGRFKRLSEVLAQGARKPAGVSTLNRRSPSEGGNQTSSGNAKFGTRLVPAGELTTQAKFGVRARVSPEGVRRSIRPGQMRTAIRDPAKPRVRFDEVRNGQKEVSPPLDELEEIPSE